MCFSQVLVFLLLVVFIVFFLNQATSRLQRNSRESLARSDRREDSRSHYGVHHLSAHQFVNQRFEFCNVVREWSVIVIHSAIFLIRKVCNGRVTSYNVFYYVKDWVTDCHCSTLSFHYHYSQYIII